MKSEEMFEIYYKLIAPEQPTPAKTESEGGYLIPEFLPGNAPGLRAWAWRVLGRIFHRRDWWERGRHMFNVYQTLADMIEKRQVMQSKTWVRQK